MAKYKRNRGSKLRNNINNDNKSRNLQDNNEKEKEIRSQRSLRSGKSLVNKNRLKELRSTTKARGSIRKVAQQQQEAKPDDSDRNDNVDGGDEISGDSNSKNVTIISPVERPRTRHFVINKKRLNSDTNDSQTSEDGEVSKSKIIPNKEIATAPSLVVEDDVPETKEVEHRTLRSASKVINGADNEMKSSPSKRKQNLKEQKLLRPPSETVVQPQQLQKQTPPPSPSPQPQQQPEKVFENSGSNVVVSDKVAPPLVVSGTAQKSSSPSPTSLAAQFVPVPTVPGPILIQFPQNYKQPATITTTRTAMNTAATFTGPMATSIQPAQQQPIWVQFSTDSNDFRLYSKEIDSKEFRPYVETKIAAGGLAMISKPSSFKAVIVEPFDPRSPPTPPSVPSFAPNRSIPNTTTTTPSITSISNSSDSPIEEIVVNCDPLTMIEQDSDPLNNTLNNHSKTVRNSQINKKNINNNNLGQQNQGLLHNRNKPVILKPKYTIAMPEQPQQLMLSQPTTKPPSLKLPLSSSSLSREESQNKQYRSRFRSMFQQHQQQHNHIQLQKPSAMTPPVPTNSNSFRSSSHHHLIKKSLLHRKLLPPLLDLSPSSSIATTTTAPPANENEEDRIERLKNRLKRIDEIREQYRRKKERRRYAANISTAS